MRILILLLICSSVNAQIGHFPFSSANVTAGPDYSDLVGQWSFDEASGDLIDQHGSDDGTATDVIYGATGKVNDAYDFERDDDAYVTITGTDFGSGDVSMCLWINIESFGVPCYVVGGDVGALSWAILADGTMFISENGSNISGTTTMALGTGTLTFIAFVYDNIANTVKFWINNSTESEVFLNTSFDSETTTIGARLTTSFSCDGIIDELYIWDAAKSDAIINDKYNGGNGKGYGE